MLKWWAYVHENGKIIIKRYWGNPQDIQDAFESTFVKKIFTPFEAETYEDALKTIK